MSSLTKEKHIPGEAGIWIFVLGDMFIFGLFFVTFAYYRSFDLELFQSSQAQLNQNWGALNTVLLLTSSWFVVLGMSAVRKGLRGMARKCLSLAWLCGLGFGIVKIFEYGEKIEHGINLTTNDFFMYYYIFTGIHFLHLIIGMGVLTYMILRLRHNKPLKDDLALLESGATYWHMVDLLWIVLFSILYLIK
ncbi:cytochrome c oxidase subunit 3 family protein [Zhongshania guokunii]|uniref:Cytochrome c oxidase subunit 3 family protein n=1 Tax=Zhongshania guokunii TaxID=641783 RepID=A0ABV3U202_9GAMM